MIDLKCIMFDCMETLIDMKELPDKKDYALWAFEGSGCEKYFNDFDEFYRCYRNARKVIISNIPEYKEYNFERQYMCMLQEKKFKIQKKKKITRLLLKNYWKNYKKRCYVNRNIKETLEYLSKKYTLGVVSNFKVVGGIEDLLKYTGIRNYFEFVINSAEVGWRKPDRRIYMDAVRKSGFKFKDIMFIGDNFVNDYLGPKELGIDSIFLDKKKELSSGYKRIYDFTQIKHIL